MSNNDTTEAFDGDIWGFIDRIKDTALLRITEATWPPIDASELRKAPAHIKNTILDRIANFRLNNKLKLQWDEDRYVFVVVPA